MKKLLIVSATTLLTLASATVCSAQESIDDLAEAATEKPAEAPKKKKPRKKLEYKSWAEAVEVAEAWDQPIVVFLSIEDDPLSSRFKMATVGNPVFKEHLILPNAVFYSYAVPAAKSKKRGKAAKNARPKPSMKSIKESEKVAVIRMAGTGESLPFVAVVRPTGRMIECYTPDPNDISFEGLFKSVQAGFQTGRYQLKLNSRVERVLKEEAKKRAKLEKSRR